MLRMLKRVLFVLHIQSITKVGDVLNTGLSCMVEEKVVGIKLGYSAYQWGSRVATLGIDSLGSSTRPIFLFDRFDQVKL